MESIEICYATLANGYTAIYDTNIESDRLNIDKITLLINSDECAHDVYLFDFYVRDPSKRQVYDTCNLYTLTEHYYHRPCIVIKSELIFSLNAVIQDWLWQFDFLWLVIVRDKSIKHFHTPVYFYKEEMEVTKEMVDDWQTHLISAQQDFPYYTEHLQGFNNRIRYARDTEESVAIIIPSKDPELLSACIQSIQESSHKNYEIFIAWNGKVKDLPKISIEFGIIECYPTSQKFNFSAVCNHVQQKHCKSFDRVLLCNDDIVVVNPNCIKEMLAIHKHQGADIVGAALYYPGEYTYDRTKLKMKYQHASIVLDDKKRFDHLHKNKSVHKHYVPTCEVPCVTFALAMITTETYQELNGMDEKYYGDCSDIDFCVRAKVAGKSIWYCAQAEAIHYESITRNDDVNMQGDPGSIDYYRDHIKTLRKVFS